MSILVTVSPAKFEQKNKFLHFEFSKVPMISVWISLWGISHPRSSVVVSVFSLRDPVTWYLGSKPQIVMLSFQLQPLQIGGLWLSKYFIHYLKRSYEVIWGHSGSFKVKKDNFQMCLITFETHWKASRLASWLAPSDPKWPQMTSYDLFR